MVATRIRFVINQQAVRDFLISPSGPVYQHVYEKGVAVQNTARRLCPSHAGTLRSSIHLTMIVSGYTVIARVGSTLPYSVFVHEGTGIYGPRHSMIYPQRGRYLVFTPSGSSGTWGQAGSGSGQSGSGADGTVFARAVKGMPGAPYLYLAMVQELPGWPVRRFPVSG